jgi:hypothetical protein
MALIGLERSHEHLWRRSQLRRCSRRFRCCGVRACPLRPARRSAHCDAAEALLRAGRAPPVLAVERVIWRGARVNALARVRGRHEWSVPTDLSSLRIPQRIHRLRLELLLSRLVDDALTLRYDNSAPGDPHARHRSGVQISRSPATTLSVAVTREGQSAATSAGATWWRRSGQPVCPTVATSCGSSTRRGSRRREVISSEHLRCGRPSAPGTAHRQGSLTAAASV